MSQVVLTETNINRQYFTTAGSEMRQLLAPLKRYGVVHFSHIRIYNDNSKTILTTHPGFSVLFYKNKFYQEAFAGHPSQYQSGIVLTQDLIGHPGENDIVSTIRQACFEYDHFFPDLTILEKHDTYVDFYFFGFPASQQYATSFIVNHLEVFQRYILFFKESGKLLIKKTVKNRFNWHERSGDTTLLTSENFQKYVQLPVNNNNARLSKKYLITPREGLVACYLQNGFSPKEMARELSISVRTIEKYIFNLRKKFDSRSMIHLVAKLNQVDWLR